MKKLLLFTFLLVFGYTVNAQEEDMNSDSSANGFGFTEGNIILEGNLGFSSTNDKNFDEKTNMFVFNPKAGYFLNENFALGIEIAYISDKEEVSGVDTEDKSSFGAGVFARYYFLDLGERFKTFTEFGVGFGTVKDKISDTKTNSFGIGMDLGINYFVKENIAITFGLSNVLSYTSAKPDGGDNISEFNANFNVFNNFFDTAQFGLMFKF